MRIWTVVEFAIGLVLLGLVLNIVQPYVPTQILPLFQGIHSIYVALVSIISTVIDAIIVILQTVKSLLPK